VINLFKIKDIRRRLFKLGLDITGDQIRAMEKKGLFSSTRNKVGYRQYSEEQLNSILSSMVLYKIGFSVEDIKENKKEYLRTVGKLLKTIA